MINLWDVREFRQDNYKILKDLFVTQQILLNI